MVKYCKALVNLALAVIVLLLVIFLVPKILVFFMPFVVGWIIAFLAGPAVRFFEEKLKIKRKAGSVFVIILAIAVVILILYWAGTFLVEEVVGLVESLPDMWAALVGDLSSIMNKWGGLLDKLPADVQHNIQNFSGMIGEYAGDLFGRLSTPTIAAVGNIAKQVPNIIISVIMTLLSAYFFVADKSGIHRFFREHMPKVVQQRYRMIKQSLFKAVGGYFKAQLRIEIWMYVMLVAGLWILRVQYAFLIAIVIAFLDFLPFFGTGTVMVPWAIIKFLNGDYKMAIGLLVIWGVGQLLRQVIQPKIVGDSVGVPPIPTLFLLFIGYKVSGVIGMILAVPLGLIVYTMYDEGVFDTTKNSIMILVSGINSFRRLKKEDLEVIRHDTAQDLTDVQSDVSPAPEMKEETHA